MSNKRDLTGYLLLSLRGIAMGAADVVPGVSGGTIAFITGIYEELVDSIRSVDIQSLRLVFQGRFKEFWLHINGNFLIALFSGILLSIFTLAGIMGYLLKTHPVFVWSFFFGLILASAFFILRDIKKFNLPVIIAFFAGGLAAWLITRVAPVTTTEAYWFIFISGMIGICAMILPGISGAFILLMLGKYIFIIDAVHEFNIPVLIVFATGAATGLILFSRVLSWLLTRFREIAIGLLSGFMIGSLGKVWPWKEAIATIISEKGELLVLQERNILPSQFANITGLDSQLAGAILMFLFGIILLIAIEHFGNKK